MGKQRKIGIYSGSFNPIHIGHLALANWLAEYTDLEEIWFVVSPQNPFKQQQTLMPDEFRLQLVREAIGDYPRFRVCDVELRLPRPSYTIDTLAALSAHHGDCEFHLIIGSDNWKVFNLWFNPQRLIAENKLIIYPRPGFDVNTDLVLHPHRDYRGERHPFLPPRKHLEIRGANGNVDAGIIPSFTCLARRFNTGIVARPMFNPAIHCRNYCASHV